MSETRDVAKDPATTDPDAAKDRIVGMLLLVSSMTGVIVAAIGAAIVLLRGQTLGRVSGKPLEVLSGGLHLDGNAITELGLLILMITPVLRVMALSISFALERRDRRYAMASLFVLILLGLGMALGRAG